MSSRSIVYRTGGVVANNDFMSKDRLAIHQAIIASKRRLRYTITLHILLALLMAVRLSVALCVLSGVRPPRFLQRLSLPRAWEWEYVWLAGGVCTLFGLMGINRNRILYIRLYAAASVLLGLAPCVYAFYDLFEPLMKYYETRETKQLFRGLPIVVMWNMFLIIAVQVHVYGFFFARSLLKAWRLRMDDRKKAA